VRQNVVFFFFSVFFVMSEAFVGPFFIFAKRKETKQPRVGQNYAENYNA